MVREIAVDVMCVQSQLLAPGWMGHLEMRKLIWWYRRVHSEVNISLIVQGDQGARAVHVLHDEFRLAQTEEW